MLLSVKKQMLKQKWGCGGEAPAASEKFLHFLEKKFINFQNFKNFRFCVHAFKLVQWKNLLKLKMRGAKRLAKRGEAPAASEKFLDLEKIYQFSELSRGHLPLLPWW